MKRKVLIIYYHEVVEDEESFSYQKIGKTKFEEQMAFLKEQGYQTLYFSELKNPIPEKAVIVSFDDGFESVYQNAMPIMKKYGIKGNVYLPTAYVGKEKFMTWDMVRELSKDGFEMQAHTHNHVDIRGLDEDGLRKEITDSNERFLSELGQIPTAFCMPFGTYDKASVRALKKIGAYEYWLGSYYGRCKEGKWKNKVLPRIGISDTDTMEVFEKKLCGGLDWKGPLQRFRLWIKSLKKERITKYEY